jgi:ABC-type phosphate/phosphonate transport system substrate-binding protein
MAKVSYLGGFSFLLLSSIALVSPGRDDKKADRPQTIHIGIMTSFYRDHPEEDVKTTVESLLDLMLAQTGFKGDPIKVEGVEKLADEVTKNELQLGVFHGHEFAWIREKHPELKPLLIVVNQIPYQRCYLFVRKEDNSASFAQLKGKSLALARHTPEPCHLFLDRQCQELSLQLEKFFSKVTHPDNVETAFDDLVDGNGDAIVVEEVAMNSYKRRKPGRFAKLKELAKSPQFPAGVVVYQPSQWNDADLKSIRGALLNAHQNPEGRQLLTLWRLTGFEPVPMDYEKMLGTIDKAYPEPKNSEK